MEKVSFFISLGGLGCKETNWFFPIGVLFIELLLDHVSHFVVRKGENWSQTRLKKEDSKRFVCEEKLQGRERFSVGIFGRLIGTNED